MAASQQSVFLIHPDERPSNHVDDGEVKVMEGEIVCLKPARVIVDDSPLLHQKERNKESLKVKLLARRPMGTLVEQGILPSPKASPALHEQRTKLEWAKTGDRLRTKIALRPHRSELVHRHILEDVRPSVDPSLCYRQRQLKRAQLVDTLSNQLSIRPGPLELIQKNILRTYEPVEAAVKGGKVVFEPTVQDGQDEESSPSSSSCASPIVVGRSESTDNLVGYATSSSEPPFVINICPSPCGVYRQRDAPGKEAANRKKKISGVKVGGGVSGGRQRTIKFHEYKGPSNVKKHDNQSSNTQEHASDELSSYDLLLKQQQVFLQSQVELGIKYPNVFKPSSSSSSDSGREENSKSNIYGRLEEMKVGDLRGILKEINLAASGSKIHLLERLKGHLSTKYDQIEAALSSRLPANNLAGSKLNTTINTTMPTDYVHQSSRQDVVVTNAQIINNVAAQSSSSMLSAADLIAKQQCQIQELKSQLNHSQSQLLKYQQTQGGSTKLVQDSDKDGSYSRLFEFVDCSVNDSTPLSNGDVLDEFVREPQKFNETIPQEKEMHEPFWITSDGTMEVDVNNSNFISSTNNKFIDEIMELGSIPIVDPNVEDGVDPSPFFGYNSNDSALNSDSMEVQVPLPPPMPPCKPNSFSNDSILDIYAEDFSSLNFDESSDILNNNMFSAGDEYQSMELADWLDSLLPSTNGGVRDPFLGSSLTAGYPIDL